MIRVVLLFVEVLKTPVVVLMMMETMKNLRAPIVCVEAALLAETNSVGSWEHASLSVVR